MNILVIIGNHPRNIAFLQKLSEQKNINIKGLIKYIIDDSPLKQNRFSPGMNIKILPRKNNINKNIDVVVVFAYEYFKDIKKFFKKIKVQFYKPIPFGKLL